MTISISSEAQIYHIEFTNRQSKLLGKCTCYQREKKRDNMKKTPRKRLYFFQHDRHTDGHNNAQIRCAYVIQIFTENFSCLSLLEAEKITFPQ